MGYYLIAQPEAEPCGVTKALMIAACVLFCHEVPGDGEQDLGTLVDYDNRKVTVSDGTEERVYTFDQLAQ